MVVKSLLYLGIGQSKKREFLIFNYGPSEKLALYKENVLCCN